jgi:hypothetical protein
MSKINQAQLTPRQWLRLARGLRDPIFFDADRNWFNSLKTKLHHIWQARVEPVARRKETFYWSSWASDRARSLGQKSPWSRDFSPYTVDLRGSDPAIETTIRN